MKFIALLTFSILATVTSLFSQNDKTLLYKDATYEEEIRTVQLYPDNRHNSNVFDSPVTQLGRMNLILEFDDLVKDTEDYRARIIHCNKQWEKSRISNIDYLYDFNEFNIRNDQFSVDTKVPYIHYTFNVPQVKLPGNYLLVVYRGNNENDIVLTERFMVYSNKVSIEVTSNLIGLNSSKRDNQQIDFKVNYKNYEILNPMESLSITLRQNERWDNAVTDLKPSFIRDHIFELEYRFFNFENTFLAGNEYRFFDMRSLRNPGQGVQRVDWSKYPLAVNLMIDQPRIHEAYSQLKDINGDFYIVNVDTGNGDTHSDYTSTQFILKSDKVVDGDVYVVGKMNNWQLSSNNKMQYNKKTELYTAELILKQGYYDYQYFVKGNNLNENYLEGNHFQTENTYEILIYNKQPELQTDLLIGYGYYEMNPKAE